MEQSARDPEAIKRDVTNYLLWDERIDSSGIFVEVHGSEVLLTGTVATFPARMQAMLAAQLVSGVTHVNNRLQVARLDAGAALEDSDLRREVESSLAWAKTLNPSHIRVSVYEGKVTLSGTVDSFGQRRNAEIITANTTGVLDVVNELMVKSLSQ